MFPSSLGLVDVGDIKGLSEGHRVALFIVKQWVGLVVLEHPAHVLEIVFPNVELIFLGQLDGEVAHPTIK